MNGILALRREHQEIEYHLIVLEEVLEENELDYKSLVSVLGRIITLLNNNERREKEFLKRIAQQNRDIEKKLEKANIFHKSIRGHLKVLKQAMASKKIPFLRIAMENDGRMLISKIRNHIYQREKLFDKILFLHLVKSRMMSFGEESKTF